MLLFKACIGGVVLSMQLAHAEDLGRPGGLCTRMLLADHRCFKQIPAQTAEGRSGARPEPWQLIFNPVFHKVRAGVPREASILDPISAVEDF